MTSRNTGIKKIDQIKRNGFQNDSDYRNSDDDNAFMFSKKNSHKK